MTGASGDGATGLARIVELGGLSVVQDPADAKMSLMPFSAMEATTVDQDYRDFDGVHQGRPYKAGGFEVHSRKPVYDDDQPQSQSNCQILGGPCWHDGSSLQAVEFAESWGGSDEQVFAACAGRLKDYAS